MVMMQASWGIRRPDQRQPVVPVGRRLRIKESISSRPWAESPVVTHADQVDARTGHLHVALARRLRQHRCAVARTP